MDYLRLTLRLKPRFPFAPASAIALALTSLGIGLHCNASTASHNPTTTQPLLRCQVAYAGTTHTIDSHPVLGPYTVPSVDIGGRFLFKPVMVGTPDRIDYIKLYAYLDASRQPVLIQVAKYLLPFKVGSRPYALTGEQYLYAGPVERELTCQCPLQGAK